MPPKKAPAKDQKPPTSAGKAPSTASTLPGHPVKFKFNFEARHEGAQQYELKLFWLNPSNSNFELSNLGSLKEWTLKPDESKKPKENVEEVAAAPPPPAPAAKGAAGKKGAAAPPAKKGAPPPEDDLDQNEPRTMLFEKELDPVNVTEELALAISRVNLKLQIFKPGDSGPSLVETIEFDLSQFLFPRASKIDAYYKKFEEQKEEGSQEQAPLPKELHIQQRLQYIKDPKIEYIDVKIQIDKPLLSEWLHKKLNPMKFTLMGAKDLPPKPGMAYKPVYAVIQFYDGTRVYTRQVPQHHFCKWAHSHTFLIGTEDPVFMREMLESHSVKVEIHDTRQVTEDEEARMQMIAKQLGVIQEGEEEEQQSSKPPGTASTAGPGLLKNQEFETMFNHGSAKFVLKDFLKSHVHSLKLRSNIFPVKKKTEDINANIDLNATAKMSEKLLEKACGYLAAGSFVVMGIDLAYPVGMHQEQDLIDEYNLAVKGPPPSATPASPDLKTAEEAIPTDTLRKSMYRTLPPRQPQDDFNQAIFERVVYIYPYKEPELVKTLNDAINEVNLKALGITDGNLRYLTTKAFSEEQRADRSLDIVGGFQIMDNDFRMLVIEGLGGKGHGIQEFYTKHLRKVPNTDKCRMLYNSEVRFKNRAYLDFNVTIKKIKLRINLAKLMASPDVYLRSKVPEDIYDTLRKISDIKKYERLRFLKDFDLFPSADLLLALERKYGDSLSHQDLFGVPKPRRKKVAQVGQESPRTSPQPHGTGEQVFEVQTKLYKSAYGEKRKEATDTKNLAYDTLMKERADRDDVNFMKKNIEKCKSLEVPREKPPPIYFPPEQEVHIYAGQRLNFYQFQKEELRKKLAQQKDVFYTYSKEYLSLAFPVVNENEIARKQKEENQNKWLTKDGFINLDKKTPQDYIKHPKKPDEAALAELTIPYHVAKQEWKDAMKQFDRAAGGEPIKGKKAFVKNVGKTEIFSAPEYFKTVHLSGDDQFKQMQEDKQKEYDDWRKKVVVNNPVIQLTLKPQKEKAHQYDRRKGLLQDKPAKKGLTLPKERVEKMRERSIGATRQVRDPPISIHMKEYFKEPRELKDRYKSDKDHIGPKDFQTTIVTAGKHVIHKMPHPPLETHEKTGPKWSGA